MVYVKNKKSQMHLMKIRCLHSVILQPTNTPITTKIPYINDITQLKAYSYSQV